MRMRLLATIACAALSLHLFASATRAAEIKVLSAAAVQIPAVDIASQFERDTGHRVTFQFATAGQIDERLAAGARPDIVINGSSRISARAKQDSSRSGEPLVRNVGTVRMGVAVRSGARRPDVSSVTAFRQALLDAQSIAYGDPARGATTGVHFAKVVDQLGLREALLAKTRLAENGLEVMRAVVRGDAELGVTQTSEILHIDATTYVGPLPDSLQLA